MRVSCDTQQECVKRNISIFLAFEQSKFYTVLLLAIILRLMINLIFIGLLSKSQYKSEKCKGILQLMDTVKFVSYFEVKVRIGQTILQCEVWPSYLYHANILLKHCLCYIDSGPKIPNLYHTMIYTLSIQAITFDQIFSISHHLYLQINCTFLLLSIFLRVLEESLESIIIQPQRDQ